MLEAIITVDAPIIIGDVYHHIIISHNDDIELHRSIDQLLILSQSRTAFCMIVTQIAIYRIHYHTLFILIIELC